MGEIADETFASATIGLNSISTHTNTMAKPKKRNHHPQHHTNPNLTRLQTENVPRGS